MGQTADLTTAGFARWGPGGGARERNFWIALACAAALHASLFIGVIVGKPKQLGDPSGAENAISVSLVTEADLKSRSTIAEPPDVPPAPPSSLAQPPRPEPPKLPEPEKTQPPPDPVKMETPQPQPEAPKPEAVKPAEQKLAKQEDTTPEELAPDLFSLERENPEKLKSEAKDKPKSPTSKPVESSSPPKPQKKRMSALDLSAPPNVAAPSFSGGRSAAFQRPPGITRSGLNDAFARAVIRALQQTMPQLAGVTGRVTVRILLSESGNVVEVRLVAGAKDAMLNQDVVFAARQTSYPIPPAGSNLADRTFLVTYIYD